MICPQASVSCSAVESPSVLVWFFNDKPVAQYLLPLDGTHQYPYSLTLSAQFANLPLEIEILGASRTASGNNFLSIMRTNFSALREAGVMNISCDIDTVGTGSMETYALNFDISKFIQLCLVYKLIIMYRS
jgi:hypothetical protein